MEWKQFFLKGIILQVEGGIYVAAQREHTSWRGYNEEKKKVYTNSHNPWGGNKKFCICVR